MEVSYEFGQHLLVNGEMLKRAVAAAHITKEDAVIDVGAGEGAITRELLKVAGKVTAFEIDKRFEATLKGLSEHDDNLTVIMDDALAYNWKDYTKIVANLPFFLAEEVIMKAIRAQIKELSLFVGGRFKELLLSDERIGLMARKFYTLDVICEVDATSFQPAPKTTVWLVHLASKEQITDLDTLLFSILTRRGKLKNALQAALVDTGKTKRQAKALVTQMDIDKVILEKPAKKVTSALLIRLEQELAKVLK